MSKRTQHEGTVVVTCAQHGQDSVLTWELYRASVGNPFRRAALKRKVVIRGTGPLSAPQQTLLVQRMAGLVLRRAPGATYVPLGLPWHEVGAPAAPGPPGGGEGGAKGPTYLHLSEARKDELRVTERLIP